MPIQNPKKVLHGKECRDLMYQGASQLAHVVGVTFGPHGRTVMLDRFAGLLATKDGVTVAKEVDQEDRFMSMGSRSLREACLHVNETAGDGTTTTAILAHGILRRGRRLIEAGVNSNKFVKGIRSAAEVAADTAQLSSEKVRTQEVLERVAYISCNGDQEIAALLADACMAVGNDGTITVEDGKGVESKLIFKEGMELNRGYASPYLADSQGERVLDAPTVAVVGAPLTSIDDVRDIMEESGRFPGRPLLIFCEVIAGDALKTVILNDHKGVIPCCVVEAPGVAHRKTDFLEDIAALSGTSVISPRTGTDHKKWDVNYFGGLAKAVVKAKSTTLTAYAEAEENIAARVEVLKAEMHAAASEYDRDRVNERIAKLAGGLAILQIGGVTENEMKEKRGRVEDALGAVQSALRTGVLPGAGRSYLAIQDFLMANLPPEDENEFHMGWKVFAEALSDPLVKLAQNAGHNGDLVAASLQGEDFWTGWDPLSGQTRSLLESPMVLDPAQVVSGCLLGAGSAASTILSVGAGVALVNL